MSETHNNSMLTPERDRQPLESAPEVLTQKMCFEIHEQFLLTAAIQGIHEGRVVSDGPVQVLEAVARLARELDSERTEIILKRDASHPEAYRKAGAVLLEKMHHTAPFLEARDQALELRAEVEIDWKQNAEISTSMMREITGFDLGHDIYRVFITHPALRTGNYFGEQQIGWGGVNDWPNYRTVYLWHEILHDDQWLGASDLNHAILELVADNELRCRLNGGSYPPWLGHDRLHSVRDRLLPYWKEFLERDSRNIREFVKEAHRLGLAS